jgi:hypothetical protein
MHKNGQHYELHLKKDQSVEATRDVPASIPSRPVDAYTPLAPRARDAATWGKVQR